MKKKALSLLLVSTMIILSITGCGAEQDPMLKMKKTDIVTSYRSLESSYDELRKENEDLKTMYMGIQSEEAPTAAISITGDGTGRFTFNSVDSKIIFPSSFNYPGAEQSEADGSLSIVNGVTIKTGSNWISKLNGTSLELEHTGGISGTVKVGKVSAPYDAAYLQSDIIAPWLETLPQSTIKYTNIYSNGNMIGVQAATPTLIDSEDAYMIIGMMSMAQYSITYVFVYRGKEDANKAESILNMLNTIQIANAPVSVER